MDPVAVDVAVDVDVDVDIDVAREDGIAPSADEVVVEGVVEAAAEEEDWDGALDGDGGSMVGTAMGMVEVDMRGKMSSSEEEGGGEVEVDGGGEKKVAPESTIMDGACVEEAAASRRVVGSVDAAAGERGAKMTVGAEAS